MSNKRSLGRGLDALISERSIDVMKSEEEVPTVEQAQKDGILKHLPVEFLERGRYQPRRDMSPEALEELANSIKAQGVMQPVVVRAIGEDRYELIAGERRWRASQLAGKDTIPAVIREVADEAAIAMALIENIQRENLNPIEEAFALQRLQDEFKLTQQEVAEAVGKSRSAVANLLRLMALADEVKVMVEHGDLEMGHARALLSLEKNNQVGAARQVVSKGLSVRQTEALVKSLQQPKKVKPEVQQTNADIKRLQNDLSEKLCAQVELQHSSSGKGKLVIKYNSLDELDGIISHIQS